MIHRIPLWALGPLFMLGATQAREQNVNPWLLLGIGLVLTLIFTVPRAWDLWPDLTNKRCGHCRLKVRPGDRVWKFIGTEQVLGHVRCFPTASNSFQQVVVPEL